MLTRREAFARLFAGALALKAPKLLAAPSANAGARIAKAAPAWIKVKCLDFECRTYCAGEGGFCEGDFSNFKTPFLWGLEIDARQLAA